MKKNLLMRSISTLLLSLLLVPMLPIQQAQASLRDDLLAAAAMMMGQLQAQDLQAQQQKEAALQQATQQLQALDAAERAQAQQATQYN